MTPSLTQLPVLFCVPSHAQPSVPSSPPCNRSKYRPLPLDDANQEPPAPSWPQAREMDDCLHRLSQVQAMAARTTLTGLGLGLKNTRVNPSRTSSALFDRVAHMQAMANRAHLVGLGLHITADDADAPLSQVAGFRRGQQLHDTLRSPLSVSANLPPITPPPTPRLEENDEFERYESL